MTTLKSFQCKVHFTDNTIANGKFGFMRVEPEISDIDVAADKFLIYKFLCKIPHDYGKPKNLIFIYTQTKSEHYVPICQLTIKNNLQKDKSLITVCVDLNSFTDDFINDSNVAQYFLHHELIVIRNFIIYNSNVNQINAHISLTCSPTKKASACCLTISRLQWAVLERIALHLIEADCLLRTAGLTKYVIMISSIDEYLYPSSWNVLNFGDLLTKSSLKWSSTLTCINVLPCLRNSAGISLCVMLSKNSRLRGSS